MGDSSARQVLIATLGAKAQLVSLALDCLHMQGNMPGEVVIVHTWRERPETACALELIQQDLNLHNPHLQIIYLELSDGHTPLRDVTSPEEVQAAFRAMYAQVRAAKMAEKTVYLLIAGGRRSLIVFGMAAAQMLFDDSDHLWHLASHPDLEESGRLHAAAGEWARLIPIPVIPWGRLSPVFNVLREVEDPFAAARQLSDFRLQEQWDMARIFVVAKLTPAERTVAELLTREGLSQNEIARRLSLSRRTVEQHLRSAYRKAAEHWEVQDVHQTQLVRLLSLFFSTC